MKLQKYAEKLIIQHHITVNSKSKIKITKQIALYMDAMIFNIISVFCLIAILNTPASDRTSHITRNTINVGIKYIDNMCKPKLTQSGGDGRMGSATFVGINEPMYSGSNPTNDILHIDFAGGIARPQIGGAHKPTLELHKLIEKYIKDILAYHRVTAKQDIKKVILNFISNYLNCFINDLKHHNGMITMSSLKTIVKTHKILHPPKIGTK